MNPHDYIEEDDGHVVIKSRVDRCILWCGRVEDDGIRACFGRGVPEPKHQRLLEAAYGRVRSAKRQRITVTIRLEIDREKPLAYDYPDTEQLLDLLAEHEGIELPDSATVAVGCIEDYDPEDER